MISSQYKIILQPTTDAGESSTFGLSDDITNITIMCFGLSGSETATVQMYDPISQTYIDMKPLQQLSVTENHIELVNLHGGFKVVKSATATPIGISICDSVIPTNVGGAL